METSALSPLTRIGCGVVLVGALLLVPMLATATPGADGCLEGYATAILEREFRAAVPSLRVQRGVITLSGAELAGLDRDRIVAALGRIRGVTRVDVVDTPAPRLVTAPAPPATIAVAASAPVREPKVVHELAIFDPTRTAGCLW